MRNQREKNERNARAYHYGRKRSGLAALLGYDLITDILDPDESFEKNRDQGYSDQLKYGKKTRAEKLSRKSGSPDTSSSGSADFVIWIGFIILLALLGAWGKSTGSVSTKPQPLGEQKSEAASEAIPLSAQKYELNSDAVSRLQARLNALGCNAGAVDGNIGKKTMSGIMRFMDSNIEFQGDAIELAMQSLNYLETGRANPCKAQDLGTGVVKLSNGWYKKFENGFWFKCKDRAFLGATYCARSAPP